MPRRSLARLYKDEFTGYSLAKFQQDLLAGLTVAAVALPLALAFGVASGASAAAVSLIPPERATSSGPVIKPSLRLRGGGVDSASDFQIPLETLAKWHGRKYNPE